MLDKSDKGERPLDDVNREMQKRGPYFRGSLCRMAVVQLKNVTSVDRRRRFVVIGFWEGIFFSHSFEVSSNYLHFNFDPRNQLVWIRDFFFRGRFWCIVGLFEVIQKLFKPILRESTPLKGVTSPTWLYLPNISNSFEGHRVVLCYVRRAPSSVSINQILLSSVARSVMCVLLLLLKVESHVTTLASRQVVMSMELSMRQEPSKKATLELWNTKAI